MQPPRPCCSESGPRDVGGYDEFRRRFSRSFDDKGREGCRTHGHDARAFSHTTIHGVPNLSTHIPNLTAKNVSPSGMRTVPLSASALNTRSASAGSGMLSV